jgi:hypothetical protein
MSAHSAAQRRSWLSALAAQVSEFVFEEVGDVVEPEPARLEPYPVIAVVSAAARSGATTVARLLAAELAAREGGAAIVTASAPTRRSAPPSRAAIRLTTAMAGVADAQPLGRLCIVTATGWIGASEASDPAAGDPERVIAAARYLAPVVLDLPPDGSAAGIASVADRIAVVAAATGEPALLDAVATVIGGDPVKVVNRVAESGDWAERADILVPDSRIAARAATIGTRPLGSLGAAVAALADALER